MSLLALVILAALIPAAMAQPCAEALEPRAVVAPTRAAREAFATADGETFHAALSTMDGVIPCLMQPLSAELSARVHTSLALAAYLEGNEEKTIGAFQAALAADPSTEVGSWLPEMHPMHLQFHLAFRLDPAPPSLLKVRIGDEIWIDGRPRDALITSQPAIVQLRRDGALLAGDLWHPGDPLPPWLELAPPRLPPETRARLRLAAAVAGGTMVTGALAATSEIYYNRFHSPASAYEDLDEYKRWANISGGAAIGAGVITTGLATWMLFRL